MQDQEASALLREYVRDGSEEACATLVSRHVNKVYSFALRHARNPHQAEEITQAVFVILARKAARLKKQVILSGWLYHTARLSALTFVRSEIRRAHREKEAQLESQNQDTDSRVWADIAPLLDDAISRLNENDRHAIVLRFFDGKSMSEVGSNLGLGEAAAKMRVSRAVEKLRVFFFRRGIAHSGAALAAAISAHSVHASPPALAKSIAATAAAGGAAAGGTATIVKGVLTAMAWTKIKTAIAGAIVIGSIVTPILVQQQANARIFRAQAELDSQRAQLADMRANRDRLDRLTQSIAVSQKQTDDLQRLRTETAALREHAKEIPKLKEEYHDLKAKLGQDQPMTPEAMKEQAIATMSAGRSWMIGCLAYAESHNGQFPTNFAQAASDVSEQSKFGANPAGQYDIVFQGSTSALEKPSDVIAFQGAEPWSVTTDGQERWAKAYVFADGHAEIQSQTQSDFSDFEQLHTAAPPADTP